MLAARLARAAARRPPRGARHPRRARPALVLRGPRRRLRGARCRAPPTRTTTPSSRRAFRARLHGDTLDFAAIERAARARRRPCCRRCAGRSTRPPSPKRCSRARRDGAPFLLADKLERLLRAARRGARRRCAARRSRRARACAIRLARPTRCAALRALAAQAADDPEPLRALGLHLARARGDFAGAADAFARAWARSHAASDAYDAGRALQRVDPARAWAWFERIPASERPRFPRLALYAAERALARGAPQAELVARRDALLRYRNTEEGREFPLVNPRARTPLARARRRAARPRLRRRGAPGAGRARGAGAGPARSAASERGDAAALASALARAALLGALAAGRRSAPRTAFAAITACRCCPSSRSSSSPSPLLDPSNPSG